MSETIKDNTQTALPILSAGDADKEILDSTWILLREFCAENIEYNIKSFLKLF